MTLGTQLAILVTILSLLVYFWTSMKVGAARGRYGIKAPAITGHQEFECYFRVQQNTMEQIILFLPGLWLFYMLMPGIWAGLIGLVWPVGRIIYAYAYYADPEKRTFGMLMTLLPTTILLIGSLVLLIMTATGI